MASKVFDSLELFFFVCLTWSLTQAWIIFQALYLLFRNPKEYVPAVLDIAELYLQKISKWQPCCRVSDTSSDKYKREVTSAREKQC